MEFINITQENIKNEHLCCAVAGMKHAQGVETKKTWLAERIEEGHTFRKLDTRGKVFIEYTPLEKAWVPIDGDNYIFIYCLWVAGGFKGQGHGRDLLEYCITDAKRQNKSGICIISSKKKKPFLSEKKFLMKYHFKVVDTIDDEYELLALSFDDSEPAFRPNAKEQKIDSQDLTIYYGLQCPYIPDCIRQIKNYCNENDIKLSLIKVDTLKKAKNMPCIFNNWSVFYKGKFVTLHLLNESYLKKMLEQ